MRNKNNPMRRCRLGLRPQAHTRLKSATVPWERLGHEASDASGSCAFQARSMRGAFPKRALRVAHGVTFVSPHRGAEKLKGVKLKGTFLREGFSEEAARSSFGKNSRNSCNSWIQKIRGNLRDPREKSLCRRISRASETLTLLSVPLFFCSSVFKKA